MTKSPPPQLFIQNPYTNRQVNGTLEQEVKIIKRKLNGFVGFANLPKQWHRKSVRRGFSFNFMVVGESGLGKRTLVNTLFNKDVLPPKPDLEDEEEVSGVKIESHAAEVEEDGVKLKLNIITTPGFGEQLNNTDAWKPIVDEINSRFDNYLEAESRVNRASVPDERVHALLYFIEPTGHSLKALDIEFMKLVHEKVNLIPVVAKSDTLTDEEIAEFKARILDDIRHQEISIFEPSVYDNDDEETVTNSKNLIATFPFAVIGSTSEVQLPDGRAVRGRAYPWGVIEVDNEQQNDFVKLRQLLIRSNLEELKESTADKLYENYRTQKLLKMGIEQDNTVFKEFDPLTKQEEERALHEAKLAKMEAEMKTVFQQKVSEKEKKLQRSEADLFARHKEMKEKLAKQIKLLEDKKVQLEKQKSLPQEPPAASVPQKTRKGFLR
ncbi:CIC11C00000004859 [Sungouiella intermedia]|uniref:CIC11C00000004859 n=1 Tax=Sungouiella intermedia TaxID=45354 RepID=A0A1L0D1X1_9ASCO|nr:CIC11C00000004859 [[Candida] intermedia]